MNLYEQLEMGETLELRMGAIISRTKLERIDSETTFVVTQPTHKLLPILFEENEMVTFFFFRENGIFSFDAAYATRGKIGKIQVCGFIAVSDVEKSQRRYSYRLPVVLDMKLRIKNEYDRIKSGEIAAKTINISQEGILITSFTKIPALTKVQMEIHLGEHELCIVGAEILRCDAPKEKGNPYLIAAIFSGLTKKDQEQISKYILHKQIEDRKRRQGI